MTNEEIEFAKNKYNDLINKKNVLEKKREKLLRLENNPAVRRYLALKKYVETADKIRNDLALDSFYEVSLTTSNSNNLLVYMGSYIRDKRGIIVLVPLREAEFVVYKDIETGTNYEVCACDMDEFEIGKKIVYLDLEKENPVSYKDAFIKLKKEFYEGLLDKSQEEVVTEILNKRKKLIKEK